jgi:UDP-N-acetylmuramyl pentapeptide phosphotransferase/UDP-N-acetylglucosamine-1-phosphate transferase
LFPKVPDQHKKGNPLVPNGLGVTYVLFTTVYLFLIYFSGIAPASNGVSAPLTLAVCILFGGFMGLLDDWMDLKWRYKAFMPLIAALPLIYLTLANPLTRTSISLPLVGMIEFGAAYYFLIIPLIVMIVTNTVNQLGGLNGLETLCPAIILMGLMALSPSHSILMLGPLIFWLILAGANLQGKIFVGNSGSFAIGMNIASFAVITDLKLPLLISIIPYVVNSSLILLTIFVGKKRADVSFDGKKLMSDHRRSLVTLITYRRPSTERRVVATISAIVAIFTLIAVVTAML